MELELTVTPWNAVIFRWGLEYAAPQVVHAMVLKAE